VERSQTLRGLIGLIDCAGGKIDTRIRVQKEAFLLAASNVGDFDHSTFVYYHFGPYSREISDALQFATSSGFISESREPGAGEGVKYSYTLTKEGRQFLAEAGSPKEAEMALVKIMDKYHWRALELAATARFLEMRKHVAGKSEAFAEAVRLKPDTKKYENDAKKLLTEIAAVI
jgi:uncharacterized protein YwgA